MMIKVRVHLILPFVSCFRLEVILKNKGVKWINLFGDGSMMLDIDWVVKKIISPNQGVYFPNRYLTKDLTLSDP